MLSSLSIVCMNALSGLFCIGTDAQHLLHGSAFIKSDSMLRMSKVLFDGAYLGSLLSTAGIGMKIVPGNLLRQGNNCDIDKNPGVSSLFSFPPKWMRWMTNAKNDDEVCWWRRRRIDQYNHNEDECNHHPTFLLDCGDSPTMLSVFYVAYASN